PAMLDYAPNAHRIAVGKRCGQRSTAQHFINKQIVDAAREHACVVRLKGGDPMLFGRAEEEMRALEAAGIDYEVVPG
ncbi:uroporphyrinogen-III C-methyltransferase, partial [Burkholderia pseudomallei]